MRRLAFKLVCASSDLVDATLEVSDTYVAVQTITVRELIRLAAIRGFQRKIMQSRPRTG